MAKTLSSRQSALIIFVAMISSKLLSLNSLISFDMKNNAWFVFFVSFVIDFLFALIFLYFIKNIKMSMFEYIKKKFGRAFSIIISILIAIMFVFKTTEIMVDIYLFFVQLIYAEINRYIFISCFIVILFYFGSRKLQNVGRTIELLMWLILLSLALSLILSVKALKPNNLLPFLNLNPLTACKSIVVHNLWFGDFWILFFFVGSIKLEQNSIKNIIWSYVISSAVCLVFVLAFTSTFGLTASMHRVCLIDITEVTPRVLNQARFNWLVYFTFPIALVIGLGIFANCTSMCIENCIREKLDSKNTISTMITIASILTIGIVFQFTFTPFYQFVTKYFVYFNSIVQYVLPIFMLVLVAIKNSDKSKNMKKNDKKSIKNIKKMSVFSKNSKVSLVGGEK